MKQDKNKSWWKQPNFVTGFIILLVVICFSLLAIELIIHRHSEFDFEGWFGFYGLFGFVAYVVLIVLAKLIRKLVKRPEDYYGD